MTLVRIIDLWNVTQPLRQTPGGRGVWDDIAFTMDEVPECDYVIVLNGPKKKTSVVCPPENIWSVIQEPPNELFRHWHHNPAYAARTYSNDASLIGDCYVTSQPVIPWEMHKDYDFLSTCPIPEKTADLSWIVSSRNHFKGHRKRLEFLETLEQRMEFDLWGRGFNYIEDKWDGIAPYRYSLAIENYSNSHYWTEKVTDCFLAWSMPVYYGCTKIEEYFPPESMIRIDIDDPDGAVEIIRDAIGSNRWERNCDAIAHARDLILNRHQLFPYMTEQIRQSEKIGGANQAKTKVVLRPRKLDAIKTISRGAWGRLKNIASGTKTRYPYPVTHMVKDILRQLPGI